MSSLTGPAPLPPLLTNPVVTIAGGTQIVLNIVAARAVDQLPRPLIDILQDASGGGSVITGTVEETSPDGTVTVGTANGTSITVHHPPELPLELGSTVVLRLIPSASAPQALLLAVNGRPVVARITAPSDAQPPAPAPAIAAAPTTRALPAPTVAAAAVVSSFVAAISLEDEATIEAALSEDRLAAGTATDKTAPDNGGSAVIAVLIRPAPARLGQVPVASGTRYLVTLLGADSAVSTAPTRAVVALAQAAIAAVSPRPDAVPSTVTATPASVPVRQAAGPTLAPVGQGAEPVLESGPIAAPANLAAAPVPEVDPAPSAPAAPPPIAPDEAGTAVTEAPGAPANGSIEGPAILVAAPIPEGEPVPSASPPVMDSPEPAVQAPIPPVAALPETAPAVLPSFVEVQSTPSASPAIGDDSFYAQSITLAGRVAPPRAPGETLVETALGTLALPLSTTLSPGLAIQLRVSAVAPPPHPRAAELAPASVDLVAKTLSPSLIEELTQVLAPIGSGLVAEIHEVLAIEPGSGLAAAIIGFLTGNRPGAAPRAGDLPSRKALLEAGRTDLAARLDHARSEIGTVRPRGGPDGWNVTILPFLGAAGIRPIRLYRKPHQHTDEDAKRKGSPSERFMLEVELKRLGPLQFDGLVRERRFDLVVRSREPFLPALQQRVAQVFQDGLLITGWHGEIDFGRIGAFPLIADSQTAHHLDLGA